MYKCVLDSRARLCITRQLEAFKSIRDVKRIGVLIVLPFVTAAVSRLFAYILRRVRRRMHTTTMYVRTMKYEGVILREILQHGDCLMVDEWIGEAIESMKPAAIPIRSGIRVV